MVDIHYIQNENLISARFKGIKIEEVEKWCAELRELVGSLSGESTLSKLYLPLIEKLEDRIIAVLIHVWPVPKDPVVMMLLEVASGAIHQARQSMSSQMA
ncbi:hypothetical protein [Massilia sp. S19_KUP03_FR1]|uniref:hypothetical protein n=1 Tax=Massilia sp. S19_KUP03_FR1 TaxID=3025503 RepID=UPI002FCCC812